MRSTRTHSVLNRGGASCGHSCQQSWGEGWWGGSRGSGRSWHHGEHRRPGAGVGSLHDSPRPSRGLLVVLGRSPTQVAPESPLPTATQQMSPCQGPHHPAPPPCSATIFRSHVETVQWVSATVSCMAQTETVSGIAVHIVTSHLLNM